ncbi:sigma factor-like helix-turn-helix DNA-binding protein [Sphaerimonospora sp. CA-214678]|uniref:sigma factor-like helix-turn-helix DNA-binding protein n=1 Tax=Sphaerimonospora sp. CA-214678 TaxID=3240029 RepID=UPI003D89C093
MGAGQSPEPSAEEPCADQIFQRHAALLHAVAFSVLGDDGEAGEVVRETRARWLAEAGGPAPRSPVGLLRIATVLALTRLRAARSDAGSRVGPWLPGPLRDEPEIMVAESISAALSTVIDALGRDERVVFLLRHAFGLAYANIAAVTRLTEAEVRRIDAEAEARVRCEVRPPERRRVCD